MAPASMPSLYHWLENECEQKPPRATSGHPLWPTVHAYTKCNSSNDTALPKQNTAIVTQTKKDQTKTVPPYFILFIITVMICVHWGGGAAARGALQWRRAAWWRQPWRIFTYSCVHGSNMHLTYNTIVALLVGCRLEMEQGHWRTAAVWWGGAAAGSLAAGVLQPAMHVVGASAAVFALLTAHLANVCLRFGHIPLWWFRVLSVGVLCVTDPICIALRPAITAGSHVAWSAHWSAAALGLPLAFLIFTGENSAKRYILVCRASATTILCAAVLCAVYYLAYLDAD